LQKVEIVIKVLVAKLRPSKQLVGHFAANVHVQLQHVVIIAARE
jgi:hypothetical protein